MTWVTFSVTDRGRVTFYTSAWVISLYRKWYHTQSHRQWVCFTLYNMMSAFILLTGKTRHDKGWIIHYCPDMLQSENSLSILTPFYWRGPRLNLKTPMSVIPSWNRLDERIQMSVVLKFFTELPWRKFFSNGVIFTHPRIFRRFLADISETVPLR